MTGRQACVLAIAVATAILGGCATGPTGPSDDFAEVPGIGVTRIDVPRPTGAGSAPCDAGPLPPASDETVLERVAALRAIGFFADRPDLSDQALATELEATLVERLGGDVPLDDPLLDLFITELDEARVWWADLEADVADGNDIYVDVVQALADISTGAFAPTAIEERWASGSGPVTIAFELAGAAHEITPAYLEDWIDPGIIVAINELIADSGERFELYKAFDQTAMVLALTETTREALEARGWCFE